ncbi:MAG TPA: PDZ domain-containing protein [Tepidisphaeraceae bacterium]|nr:PDZ domain-containing protein [Tepidisphaeraceae bacterium]
MALARESIGFIDIHDLDSAEARLRAAIAILPGKAIWQYNLACILTARKRIDAAMEALGRATELGFSDFTILESDADLKPLHELPAYQALIARKKEINHQAAELAMNDLKSRFGKDYLYEVDEDRKLIFATNIDRATLDALKIWLHDQAKSQEEQLFAHKSDEFIRVVVPSLADYRKLVRQRGVMGIYEDETRTLLAERMGQVMTHEFTHALHAADQRAVRQEHPVWLREGLASMYEAGEFENGELLPRDNFRLAFIQSAARRHALIPLEKLLTLTTRDFVNSPNLAYGESSSLLLYLYEKKSLRKFYDAYKASYGSDPSGGGALESVTQLNLVDLQSAWTQWMLGRKSPQLVAAAGGPYLGLHFGEAIDGLKVSMVLPSGSAAKAGIKLGDVIVGLNDREVRDNASLAPLLSAHRVGDEIRLKVRRDGKYIDVPVTLGQR